jgi:hypothetical protein
MDFIPTVRINERMNRQHINIFKVALFLIIPISLFLIIMGLAQIIKMGIIAGKIVIY